MNEERFTPGPWMITHVDCATTHVWAVGVPIIADVKIRFVSVNAWKANTALIAAAPDMYGALVACCDLRQPECEEDECSDCPIGIALKKARGEE